MAEGKHTTKEALDIGKKLGLTWKKVKPETLRQGMDVEEEHNHDKPTDSVNTNVAHGDMNKVAKIAIVHLGEMPDYYTRLEKMEKEGKKNIIRNQIKRYGNNKNT